MQLQKRTLVTQEHGNPWRRRGLPHMDGRIHRYLYEEQSKYNKNPINLQHKQKKKLVTSVMSRHTVGRLKEDKSALTLHQDHSQTIFIRGHLCCHVALKLVYYLETLDQLSSLSAHILSLVSFDE